MELTQDDTRKLPGNTKSLFTVNPELFESFIKANWTKVTKAGFVFQLQPYDPKIKPVVLHIKPTINGKASEDIINILQDLRTILKNRRINIRSFAFDGDTAYYDLHLQYYSSYIKSCFNNNTLNLTKTRAQRVVSDFLHLIKRLRYRLLQCIIHAGFSPGKFISIEEIRKTLSHLPDVVFNNQGFTKMNDRLPLLLFAPDSFIKLLEAKDFTALGYWFPITASIIALDSPDLNRSARTFFLQCAFWFLVYYAKLEEGSFHKLKQKKRGDSLDVTFYTKQLLVEFTNTIHCHLQLMNSFGEYSFDRNSSMPLEHLFGRARVKAKDIHTLKKFIKNISQLQTDIAMDSDETIPGRRSSFGAILSASDPISEFIDKDELFSIHDYTPQKIAIAALVLAGFAPVTGGEIKDIDMKPFYWFCNAVEAILPDQAKRKTTKKALSLKAITLGTDSGFRSKALIKSQCPAWFKDKESKDSNGNKKKYTFHQLNFLNTRDFFKKLKKDDAFEPKKADLLQMCKEIQQHDPLCPKIPTNKHSLETIYQWYSENYKSYEVFLHSLIK